RTRDASGNAARPGVEPTEDRARPARSLVAGRRRLPRHAPPAARARLDARLLQARARCPRSARVYAPASARLPLTPAVVPTRKYPSSDFGSGPDSSILLTEPAGLSSPRGLPGRSPCGAVKG